MTNSNIPQKYCTRCAAIKPASVFYKNRTHSDGLSAYCKECHKIINKQSAKKAQQRNLADTLITRKLLARIFSKIHISTISSYNETPCWEWTAGMTDDGYGLFTINGRAHGAHRVLYFLFVESVPPHLECDHLCQNRGCVNPCHIEIVTPKVNCLRGESFAAINARKTHCNKGHEFTPDNIKKVKDGKRCRTCRREQAKEYMKKKYKHLMSLPDNHPDKIRYFENKKRSRVNEHRKRRERRALLRLRA